MVKKSKLVTDFAVYVVAVRGNCPPIKATVLCDVADFAGAAELALEAVAEEIGVSLDVLYVVTIEALDNPLIIADSVFMGGKTR